MDLYVYLVLRITCYVERVCCKSRSQSATGSTNRVIWRDVGCGGDGGVRVQAGGGHAVSQVLI